MDSSLSRAFTESALGLALQTDKLLLFFGSKNATIENLKTSYPDLTFRKIKQTHSDIFVENSVELVEADAHFTTFKNTALLISSADCLPILVYCHQTERVASIHAGWKGVSNQIVFKSLKKLIATGSTEKKFSFWIGPHIQQNSFEIEFAVLQQLKISAYNLKLNQYSQEKDQKYYVDLNQIVSSQITAASKKENFKWFSNIDTKTNNNYWSYRREKDKAGRNLSFITLLK